MTPSGVGGPGRPGAGMQDLLAALRDGRIQGDEARLRASSKLMEGMFYEQLFKAMRETVPEGGALSSSEGQKMFEGMLDERMAEAAALSSEGGMGDALFRHFSRFLEAGREAGGDPGGEDG